MKDGFPILANKFLAALAEPRRGIKGYKGGKYAESKRRNLQADVATSQKFVLSNNLVEHAYLASLSKPKHLIEMLDRGIPPFNNMWIEWDEQFRAKIIAREFKRMGFFEEYYKLHPKKIGENPPEDALKTRAGVGRVGYHIRKLNSGYFFEIHFSDDETKGEAILSAPKGFFVGGFNRFFWNTKLDETNSEKEREDLGNNILDQNSALLGQWYTQKRMSFGGVGTESDKISITLLTSFALGEASAMSWLVPQHALERGLSDEEKIEMQKASLLALQGDARFLIALLGLLNYDLVVHDTVTTPKQIDHKSFGRVIPKSEYKVVTIDLPKPRGKRIYERMFTGQGSPKREHWRRGHWRSLKDAFGRIRKRVWIDEMKVGNPKLGSIIHDYDLQAKKPQVFNLEDMNDAAC